MREREPRTLRPGRVRAVLGVLLSTPLVVIAIGVLVSLRGETDALTGLIVSAILTYPFLAFAFAVFHPRSRATRLDAQGFRVWNRWGRPAYSVAWERVAELGPVPSKDVDVFRVGFRCEPPLAPGWWQRLLARDMEGFDGRLPDYYAGFDPTLALMLEYGNEARAAQIAARWGLAIWVDVEAGELVDRGTDVDLRFIDLSPDGRSVT